MKSVKFSIFIICFLFVQNTVLTAQLYQLSNELEIFSFETLKGKKLSICKDQNDKYIVYRYGTKTKVELQYPSVLNTESWAKFTFTFFSRGGGIENAGMDLNALEFTSGGFTFSVYQDYTAESDKLSIGIIVTQLSNKKETKIIGNINTKKGYLSDLRDNHLVKKGE